MEPRDYYLSKLYQFIYESFRAEFGVGDPEHRVAAFLQDALGRIPDSRLPPNCTAEELDNLFLAVYATLGSQPIDEALLQADLVIEKFLRPELAVGQIKRKPGRPGLSPELKELALEAKRNGASSELLASIVYATKYPDKEQKSNVFNVLKHFQKSRKRT